MKLDEFKHRHAAALAFYDLRAQIDDTDDERVELWHGTDCEQIVTIGIAPVDLRSFFEALRSTEAIAYRKGRADAHKEIAKALGINTLHSR